MSKISNFGLVVASSLIAMSVSPSFGGIVINTAGAVLTQDAAPEGNYAQIRVRQPYQTAPAQVGYQLYMRAADGTPTANDLTLSFDFRLVGTNFRDLKVNFNAVEIPAGTPLLEGLTTNNWYHVSFPSSSYSGSDPYAHLIFSTYNGQATNLGIDLDNVSLRQGTTEYLRVDSDGTAGKVTYTGEFAKFDHISFTPGMELNGTGPGNNRQYLDSNNNLWTSGDNNTLDKLSYVVAAVPEPTSLGLLGGVFALALRRRTR